MNTALTAFDKVSFGGGCDALSYVLGDGDVIYVTDANGVGDYLAEPTDATTLFAVIVQDGYGEELSYEEVDGSDLARTIDRIQDDHNEFRR